METDERKDTAYKLFFNAIRAKNVAAVVEAAYSLFDQSPVVLADKHERLIAQIPNEKIGELAYDILVDYQHIPEETLWAFQQDLMGDRPRGHVAKYCYTGYAQAYPRITGPVFFKDKILGHYAIMLGERPLQKDDMEIAEMFVDTLSTIMRIEETDSLGNESLYSSCLSDLLEDASPTALKSMSAVHIQGALSPPYLLLAIPVEQNAGTYSFATAVLLPYFSENIPEGIATLFEGCIVLLINENQFDEHYSIITPQNRLHSMLNQYKLTAGISTAFQGLENCKMYYNQALLTAKLVEREPDGKRYNRFNDFMPRQVFLSIVEHIDADTFVAKEIQQIEQYDTENNSEYYNTLKEYLLCFCRKDVAAKNLNIHRNSLQYRISRISELFGIDMEDNAKLLTLLISVMINEYV